jgi:hypothetical protein
MRDYESGLLRRTAEEKAHFFYIVARTGLRRRR